MTLKRLVASAVLESASSMHALNVFEGEESYEQNLEIQILLELKLSHHNSAYKRNELASACRHATKYLIKHACLNHQPIKGTLVSQCFMHLMREDHQALLKQFCSVLMF